MGGRRELFDRLVGLVAIFDEPSPSDTRTYIEASQDGWWYAASLPGNQSIAVYFTDADLVQSDELFWQRRLNSARLISERLTTARRAGPLRTVSAASTLLDRVMGEEWLAVGDAACTIDPLSSQGIGWAIASGIEAARAIIDPDQTEAVTRYATGLLSRYQDYLEVRRSYYDRERRWPDSLFWLRRRGTTVTAIENPATRPTPRSTHRSH
jgi:flavin-dependent dehydrogenase